MQGDRNRFRYNKKLYIQKIKLYIQKKKKKFGEN